MISKAIMKACRRQYETSMIKQQKLLIGANSTLQGDLYELAFRSQGVLTARAKLGELMQAIEANRPNIVFISTDTVGPKITSQIKYTREGRGGRDRFILCVARTMNEAAKLEAFAAGADDIFSEPTSLAVIIGRLRYFLGQRIAANQHQLIASGDIKLDLVSGTAQRGHRPVRLTPTEFQILKLLMATPDRPVTRQELLDNVWGQNAQIDIRTVDVTLNRLRRALSSEDELDPIRSIRGQGYVFRF